MSRVNDRINICIEEIKLLNHSTIGYSGSGVFPKRDSYFYRVKAKDSNQVYTISTTKKLYEEDCIRASVKGTTSYRGEDQIGLSRVDILIPSRFRKDCDFSEFNRSLM